ncbi:MAG: hypothetical protein RLZZ127_994, partial [Planctomycetota bacterium]
MLPVALVCRLGSAAGFRRERRAVLGAKVGGAALHRTK